MFKNLVISWLFLLLTCFQTYADAPDICLNEISKAACRVSAGPNRGSGVAIYLDETYVYVLTNAHVIESYNNITVEFYKYGAKTTPLPCKINGKVMDTYRDFAILSVSRNYFGNMLPNIIPLVPPDYKIVANTYFATAGNPFSRDMTAREGRILGMEGNSRILFTPPPDQGQSGSGLFVRIGDKIYVAGIITFKSGDYSMDMNGFPTTYGAAFHINMLRQNLTPTNDTQRSILYPVSEQLYALGSDGKWYPQQGLNAVSVPPGIQIVQWNCPNGKCRPIQQQPRMVPLPRPIVPSPRTTAPPAQNNSAPFQNLPDGFGGETPKLVDPDVTAPELDIIPEQTTQLKELQDKYDTLNTQYLALKTEYDELQLKLKTLETELSTKDTSIKNLEDQIIQLKNQSVPDDTALEAQKKALEEKQAELEKQQAQINELNIQITQKTEQIKKYELDISILQDMLDQVPETTPTDTIQKPSIWNRITNTAKNLNPLWALLLGAGGTLLLGKYKLLGKIPAALIGLLKAKNAVDTIAPSATTTNTISIPNSGTDLNELIKWLNGKFDNSSAKLDGLTDYVASKLADTNTQSININIDNESNDTKTADGLGADGLDYKKLYKGTTISDRIKQFFELKKRDGDSVEKWAFYAVLYREAMQLLRRGKLEIDVVGNKVPLQGQKLAADRIDSWVREQFLKRTTIDQLDQNYLYHEAMIGFLYKEAVKLLRVGFFPVLGAKDTADAIESWVKQEFLERMGITL